MWNKQEHLQKLGQQQQGLYQKQFGPEVLDKASPVDKAKVYHKGSIHHKYEIK